MVQLILKNHSYVPIDAEKSCVNNVLYDRFYYEQIRFYVEFAQGSADDKNALIRLSPAGDMLTFLACGRPPLQKIAFGELLKVFSREIWQLVLAFVLLLTLVMATIVDSSHKENSKLKKSVSICIQFLKVLLEQGDPFSAALMNQERLRICIGTFLLVGIVLSNAYKSENVYNLVLAWKPIPYENASQLLKDNFKIYSRGQVFRIWEYLKHSLDNDQLMSPFEKTL